MQRSEVAVSSTPVGVLDLLRDLVVRAKGQARDPTDSRLLDGVRDEHDGLLGLQPQPFRIIADLRSGNRVERSRIERLIAIIDQLDHRSHPRRTRRGRVDVARPAQGMADIRTHDDILPGAVCGENLPSADVEPDRHEKDDGTAVATNSVIGLVIANITSAPQIAVATRKNSWRRTIIRLADHGKSAGLSHAARRHMCCGQLQR